MLALIGLYFLCIKVGNFRIEKGDYLELAGAFFWASQILVIDKFVNKVDSLILSFIQFLACAVMCFIVSFSFETFTLENIFDGIIPILYGGLGSVGIAYTLQTVAQRDAIPSHSALILSSEIVFGTIGGIIFFNENLGSRGYIGCLFIVAGVILSIVKSENKGV